MTRFHERIVRPGWYHLLRIGRLILFPLLTAGGLAFLGRELLGLPLAVQIIFWAIGLLIGIFAWATEYLDDPEETR